MSLFTDILKGLPENAVLRGKVKEAEAENAALQTENAILKDDNRTFKIQIQQLKAEVMSLKDEIQRLTHKPELLSEVESKILDLIGHDERYGVAIVLTEGLGLPEQKAEYYLRELVAKDYLDYYRDIYEQDRYSITQKGRKYLIDLGLL